MSSPLQLLSDIISTNIHALESAYAKAGLAPPNLNDPYSPSPLASDVVVAHAAKLIIAAASQLIATVQSPLEVIQEFSAGMHQTAAIGFAEEFNLADVLLEGGQGGLHIDQIGALAGTNGATAGRILRYLATRHIFTEVKPNTYSNNRISSVLRKEKTLKEIQEDPSTKYEGARSAAFVNHFATEAFKSTSFVTDFIKDPMGFKAPFNMAVRDSKDVFAWYQLPENRWRGARFSVAMHGIGEMRFPPELHVKAFDWNSLAPGSVVADVGGNIGSVTLQLAKEFSHLNFVVMDLEHAIKEAKPYWTENYPEALAEQRVKLQVHSFLTPMPLKASIYFLRAVIHDWPEADCIKILSHIRVAAGPDSKLILFELIVPLACEDPTTALIANHDPALKAPEPLLPNFGIAGGWPTWVDLQMLALFDSRERTIQEYIALGDAAGWKLDYVRQQSLGAFVFSPK
ncbi:hypothetical protein HGRIS_011839 [Hohenbuehelia grisea]|uniref:O-methyltransferase C-terminal domain-containing protein n=1 Tax=Hohenbuehelia grisea TaxID=104357 RepID=A0ABR3JYL6_9AGAR